MQPKSTFPEAIDAFLLGNGLVGMKSAGIALGTPLTLGLRLETDFHDIGRLCQKYCHCTSGASSQKPSCDTNIWSRWLHSCQEIKHREGTQVKQKEKHTHAHSHITGTYAQNLTCRTASQSRTGRCEQRQSSSASGVLPPGHCRDSWGPLCEQWSRWCQTPLDTSVRTHWSPPGSTQGRHKTMIRVANYYREFRKTQQSILFICPKNQSYKCGHSLSQRCCLPAAALWLCPGGRWSGQQCRLPSLHPQTWWVLMQAHLQVQVQPFPTIISNNVGKEGCPDKEAAPLSCKDTQSFSHWLHFLIDNSFQLVSGLSIKALKKTFIKVEVRQLSSNPLPLKTFWALFFFFLNIRFSSKIETLISNNHIFATYRYGFIVGEKHQRSGFSKVVLWLPGWSCPVYELLVLFLHRRYFRSNRPKNHTPRSYKKHRLTDIRHTLHSLRIRFNSRVGSQTVLAF